MYFIRTPWLIRKIYNDRIWDIRTQEKSLYLTFDDGPHPEATPFVLDELRKFNAKATFFCIGKNVVLFPEIYKRILAEEHAVGNHTYDHINGWKSSNDNYLHNTRKAAEVIHSNLFRPPYGRINRSKVKELKDQFGLSTIMWTVLSGDFDLNKSANDCLNHVIQKATPGSIIVFHDSQKAFDKLRYALPLVLKYFTEKGYNFKKIEI